jgi:hypothetical protein
LKIEKPLLKKNKKNIHGKSIYDTVKKNKKKTKILDERVEREKLSDIEYRWERKK